MSVLAPRHLATFQALLHPHYFSVSAILNAQPVRLWELVNETPS